jgi:SAM-dependent methyltransferase
MIALARKKASRAGLRNVRFFRTSAEDLQFPEGFFDAVISNCGIPIAGLSGVLKEILRVVRPGGKLVFNDWHLIDVKPHRIFGDVLGRYRTPSPSPELARERSALAKLERCHHSLSSEVQRQTVSDTGFGKVVAISHQHKVRLKSVDFYLKMRMTRATIGREFSEMSPDNRKGFAIELRDRLQEFRSPSAFVFDWPVFYISAEKPP